MSHWFYVGRDVMWVYLGIIPLLTMSEGNFNRDGFFLFVGVVVQILWVCAAVNGWFK